MKDTTLRVQVYVTDPMIMKALRQGKREFDEKNGFISAWSQFVNALIVKGLSHVAKSKQREHIEQ